jgi:environmental stress-induced protein Ves
MPWANGGGWTTEIVAVPSADGWEWRLSMADVDSAGPFSAYPDVDRTIALLRGNGFALAVGDHKEATIDQPFEPFEFSGDDTTRCRLLDGPVQDLNLMCRRGVALPRVLEFVEVADESSADVTQCDVVIVVAGRLRVDQLEYNYLDALRHFTGTRPLDIRSAGNDRCVLAIVRQLL